MRALSRVQFQFQIPQTVLFPPFSSQKKKKKKKKIQFKKKSGFFECEVSRIAYLLIRNNILLMRHTQMDKLAEKHIRF